MVIDDQMDNAGGDKSFAHAIHLLLVPQFAFKTRTVKAFLPHLPLLIIWPGGFAVEFEYGIRPLIKPLVFKHFTFAGIQT